MATHCYLHFPISPKLLSCNHSNHAAVVIGFVRSNTSVTVEEGSPPQTVYIDVKPEGLPLDAFDNVPINIRTTMGKVQ